MKKLNVALVGAGLVGREIWKILWEREFPVHRLCVFARRGRKEKWFGQSVSISPIENADWRDFDLVFFAGTEGEKGASRQWGWQAVQEGAFVIDNGRDFRLDPRVPLVVPEVNGEDLARHQGFVANPNCSTIQMVMALAPLHRSFQLQKVVVATYQSVSGSGQNGVRELERQIREYPNRSPGEVYSHPILANLIPQIGEEEETLPGYFQEEGKMLWESRKIFHLPDLQVEATCVRVPVFRGHSEALVAGFAQKVELSLAKEALSHFPGLCLLETPPVPWECEGKDEVFVGRLRRSVLGEHWLSLWCVADNVRKGAALNAVQIAELALERGWM